MDEILEFVLFCEVGSCSSKRLISAGVGNGASSELVGGEAMERLIAVAVGSTLYGDGGWSINDGGLYDEANGDLVWGRGDWKRRRDAHPRKVR